MRSTALVRGLVRWDRLAEKPPLEPAFCLPIVPVVPLPSPAEPAELHPDDARELARWQRTRWYRVARWRETRAPGAFRLAKAICTKLGF